MFPGGGTYGSPPDPPSWPTPGTTEAKTGLIRAKNAGWGTTNLKKSERSSPRKSRFFALYGPLIGPIGLYRGSIGKNKKNQVLTHKALLTRRGRGPMTTLTPTCGGGHPHPRTPPSRGILRHSWTFCLLACWKGVSTARLVWSIRAHKVRGFA